jgi:hypothetical protein
MNARRWLTSEDVRGMLDPLAGKKGPRTHADLDELQEKCGERKVGLFAVACCRRVWQYIASERVRTLVENAEQFFDGLASDEAPGEAVVALLDEAAWQGDDWSPREEVAVQSAATVLIQATGHSLTYYGDIRYGDERFEEFMGGLKGLRAAAAGNRSALRMRREEARQANLLRDVLGNPFLPPPAVDRAWLSWHNGTTRKLARAIYEERELPGGTLDNARLAVLADALEDAGCTNADILDHCRGGGEHVRGCWCLDLLLGRS